MYSIPISISINANLLTMSSSVIRYDHRTDGKTKLAASPVRHRIFDLGWVIEIGWDLDQDKFSLKVQDILFKDLAREEF